MSSPGPRWTQNEGTEGGWRCKIGPRLHPTSPPRSEELLCQPQPPPPMGIRPGPRQGLQSPVGVWLERRFWGLVFVLEVVQANSLVATRTDVPISGPRTVGRRDRHPTKPNVQGTGLRPLGRGTVEETGRRIPVTDPTGPTSLLTPHESRVSTGTRISVDDTTTSVPVRHETRTQPLGNRHRWGVHRKIREDDDSQCAPRLPDVRKGRSRRGC